MRGFIGALCAIGLGAFVGALIALGIDSNDHGWWVVGAFAGGGVAWACYDIRQVGRVALAVARNIGNALVDSNFWRVFGSHSLAGVAYVSSVLFFVLSANVLNEYSHNYRQFINDFGLSPTSLPMLNAALSVLMESAIVASIVGPFFGLIISGFYKGHTHAWDKEDRVNEADRLAGKGVVVAWYTNPIACFFWAGVAIGALAIGIGEVAKFIFLDIPRGIWKIVRMVHNDTRALCFIYGSMGATAGYFIGHNVSDILHAVSPLAGAAAGMGLAAIGRALIKKPVPVPISHE